MSGQYDHLAIALEEFKWLRPQIYSYTIVSSTNDIARSLIDQGAEDGTVAVAEEQFQGHGRIDRVWYSPRGGLYASIILESVLSVEHAPLLGILCGVAAVQAVRQVSNMNVLLKWPNDLMLNGKKFGGILSELVLKPKPLVIVGVGININTPLQLLPPSIQAESTSLLHETGHSFSLSELLLVILKRIDDLLVLAGNTGSFDKILLEWKRLNATLGNRVNIIQHAKTVEGVAINIDNWGRLIVRQADGTEVTIFEGDVVHLTTK